MMSRRESSSSRSSPSSCPSVLVRRHSSTSSISAVYSAPQALSKRQRGTRILDPPSSANELIAGLRWTALLQYGMPILAPCAIMGILAPYLSPATAPTLLPSLAQQVPPPTLHLPGNESWNKQLSRVFDNCSTPDSFTATAYPGSIRTGFVSYPRSVLSLAFFLLTEREKVRQLVPEIAGRVDERLPDGIGLLRSSAGQDVPGGVRAGQQDHGQDSLACAGSRDPGGGPRVLPLIRSSPPSRAQPPRRHRVIVSSAEHRARGPVVSDDSSSRDSRLTSRSDHTARIQGTRFDDSNRDRIIFLAARWRDHADYWSSAPLYTSTLRYEDLTSQKAVEVGCILLPARSADESR